MARIVVVGGGQIGRAITQRLARARHSVVQADQREPSHRQHWISGVQEIKADARDQDQLAALLRDQDVVVSACPFYLNESIARVAREQRVHYLDLTEDVATTRAIQEIAEGAETAFIPQCGLAPGYVGILAGDMVRAFDRVDRLQLRVGALPLYPHNALKYNLTWSTDGLINEYCNPCEAIVDGRRMEVRPLEGVESFALDGVDYEAFNTSGGVGSLCGSLAGRVANLNYKTIRYPGHRDAMRLLLHDLGLAEDRLTLKAILERTVPQTNQDVVVVLVTAVGRSGGRLLQKSRVSKIYGSPEGSAIQRTTSAGVCAIVELLLKGRISDRGFVRQEDAGLQDFLETEDGAIFRAGAIRPEGCHPVAKAAV